MKKLISKLRVAKRLRIPKAKVLEKELPNICETTGKKVVGQDSDYWYLE